MDVRFPVFNGHTVRVIVSANIKRTGQHIGVDLEDNIIASYVQSADGRKRWLVFRPDPDEGTIAHEAAHAIRAMFAYRGVRNDDETFAYHLDYMVRRIHKFLKRGKR